MKPLVMLVLFLLIPAAAALSVTDLEVTAIDALCSDATPAGNWDASICQGTYTTAADACTDALVSCDDANAEVHTNFRDDLVGVDVRAANVTIDPVTECSSIDAVRVAYRYTPDNIDDAFLEISTDQGASYIDACGGAPGAGGVTTSCDVTADHSWSCSDFFGASSQARARLSAIRTTGNPNQATGITINYLVFFINYTVPTPQISDVSVRDVSARGATVSWQTGNASNATLRYGLTTGYGLTLTNSSFALNHEFTLSGLEDDSTYFFEVESCTQAGVCEVQGPFEFSTLEEVAPSISDFLLVVDEFVVNVSWSTDRNATSTLEYGTSLSYGVTISNITESTTHFFRAEDLAPATTYFVRASSCDELGCASVTDSFKTAPPLTGCSYRYAETAADHEPGVVKRGDVVVVDCRLSAPVRAREELRVQLAWPHELLRVLVSTPRLLYQEPEVLLP